MSQVAEVAKAVQVLAPLVEQVVEYLRGGANPEFFVALPEPLRSRIVLEARKAKQSR